jgi:hypothetical protein
MATPIDPEITSCLPWWYRDDLKFATIPAGTYQRGDIFMASPKQIELVVLHRKVIEDGEDI